MKYKSRYAIVLGHVACTLPEKHILSESRHQWTVNSFRFLSGISMCVASAPNLSWENQPISLPSPLEIVRLTISKCCDNVANIIAALADREYLGFLNKEDQSRGRTIRSTRCSRVVKDPGGT